MPKMSTDQITLLEMPFRSPAILANTVNSSANRLRMAELGLRAGTTISVLTRTSGGGRIIAIGHSRIAIDRTLAATLTLKTAPR